MTKFNKNLILVGGGGFALEIYSYLLEEILNQTVTNLSIKGVLDKSSSCELMEKHPELKYLGDVDEYITEENDIALIAVGNAVGRRTIAQKLKVLCLHRGPIPQNHKVCSSLHYRRSSLRRGRFHRRLSRILEILPPSV